MQAAQNSNQGLPRQRGLAWLFVLLGLTASCGFLDLAGSDDSATPSATRTAPAQSTTVTPTVAPSTEPTTEAPPTTVAPNFSDTYAAVSDGVFRVDSEFCNGSGSQGTGFLIDESLILTAAHVTGDASEVDVSRADGFASTASVIATDAARDLAVLSLSHIPSGHHFTIDDAAIRVGDEVAALGHPRGLPLTFTSGRISSVHYAFDGVGFHQTDAPINPGNSGGPLINEQGHVIGLVDWKFVEVEGISFVVTGSELNDFINGPGFSTVDIDLGCAATEVDPEWQDDAELLDISIMFEEYAALISAGEEGEAYDRFVGSELGSRVTREQFMTGNSTSTIDDMNVYYAYWDGPDRAIAWVSFTSYQDEQFGADGQTCSLWDLTYVLSFGEAGWMIEKASNEPASPTACDT